MRTHIFDMGTFFYKFTMNIKYVCEYFKYRWSLNNQYYFLYLMSENKFKFHYLNYLGVNYVRFC